MWSCNCCLQQSFVDDVGRPFCIFTLFSLENPVLLTKLCYLFMRMPSVMYYNRTTGSLFMPKRYLHGHEGDLCQCQQNAKEFTKCIRGPRFFGLFTRSAAIAKLMSCGWQTWHTATSSWPCVNKGSCKYTPKRYSVWPWALLMVILKAKRTVNCQRCHSNEKVSSVGFSAMCRISTVLFVPAIVAWIMQPLITCWIKSHVPFWPVHRSILWLIPFFLQSPWSWAMG